MFVMFANVCQVCQYDCQINRISRTMILLVKIRRWGKGTRAGSFPVPPFQNKQEPALFQFPPFKITSFIFVLRVITAKCVMLRCKVCKEQICSELSICSPRQTSLHCDNVK